jgi:hypothetical protein
MDGALAAGLFRFGAMLAENGKVAVNAAPAAGFGGCAAA